MEAAKRFSRLLEFELMWEYKILFKMPTDAVWFYELRPLHIDHQHVSSTHVAIFSVQVKEYKNTSLHTTTGNV